ncbi:MAG: helix-turn-helix transcriptional regulator [Clostridia bacterium]|nr:helix-turn-helix transcriptional regulator [Clostridia bacterium]
MTFAEKLKRARKEKGLSQSALAERAGISLRTLQNYEMGKRYPASMEIGLSLATALGTTVQELLSAGEESIVKAATPTAKAQLAELVRAVSGLFAGGEIGEEDRDAAMEAIIAAYWAAKKESRKAEMSRGREEK